MPFQSSGTLLELLGNFTDLMADLEDVLEDVAAGKLAGKLARERLLQNLAAAQLLATADLAESTPATRASIHFAQLSLTHVANLITLLAARIDDDCEDVNAAA